MVTGDDEIFFGFDRERKKDKTTTAELVISERERTKEKLEREATEMEFERPSENKPRSEKCKLEEDIEHLKLSLRIPDNISELLQIYITETVNVIDKSQIYRIIKKAYLFSKNCKSIIKFNCEVDINTRTFNKVTFYEVFFREMYSTDNRN